MTTKAETGTMCFEDGGNESQAKECRYPLKAEKGNKTNSPLESPEGMQPC